MRDRRPPEGESIARERSAGPRDERLVSDTATVVSNQQVARHVAARGEASGAMLAVLGSAGNAAIGRWAQPQLEVGSSSSALEREADQVAAVVAADIVPVESAAAGVLPAGEQLAHPDVGDALQTRGEPLSPRIRGAFESRLRHNFADVRVHRDSSAPAAIGARAFTVGADIVFAPGRYAPGREDGQRLLAHELTHVVQQRAGASGPVQRSEDDVPAQARSGAVPVVFGMDQTRTIYVSVTVPGHTVAEISTY